MKQLTLTELVVSLSQHQQAALREKSVQILALNEKGERVMFGVGAVFGVKELPDTVIIQATNTPL